MLETKRFATRFLLIISIWCTTFAGCDDYQETDPYPPSDPQKEADDVDVTVEQPTYVDVRTAEEYSDGHFPDAVNIPVSELSDRLDELEPKNRAIVVYCRSGARSAQAKTILNNAGYTNVIDGGPLSRLE